MPSKEDICVVPDPKNFLQSDMEELVAAIKHNLHLKSKKHTTKNSRRTSPYAAPVRSACRNKTNTDEHSSSNCKYCILKSSANSKDSCPQDPYEILTYLRKGILISEAVKRLQECKTNKKMDFYDLEEEFEVNVVESVWEKGCLKKRTNCVIAHVRMFFELNCSLLLLFFFCCCRVISVLFFCDQDRRIFIEPTAKNLLDNYSPKIDCRFSIVVYLTTKLVFLRSHRCLHCTIWNGHQLLFTSTLGI